MKNFTIIIGLFIFTNFSFTNEIWLNDYDKALQQARTQNKMILLVFSGSDWCKPCIRLEQQVLSTDVFREYATENLILLKADFPRKRKNRLTKTQQQHNDQLAEKYNSAGAFPYAVLLDSEGEAQKSLNTNVENVYDFIKQIPK